MEQFYKLLIVSFGFLDLISRLHHGVFLFVDHFADQRNLCLCAIVAQHLKESIVQPLRLTKCVTTCHDILTSEFLAELIAASQNEVENNESFMYIRYALRTLYSQLHATKHELQTMMRAEAIIDGMPGVEASLWGNFKRLIPAKLDELQRVLPQIMNNFFVVVERPPDPCLGIAHHFYTGQQIYNFNVEKVLRAMSVRHSAGYRHPLW